MAIYGTSTAPAATTPLLVPSLRHLMELLVNDHPYEAERKRLQDKLAGVPVAIWMLKELEGQFSDKAGDSAESLHFRLAALRQLMGNGEMFPLVDECYDSKRGPQVLHTCCPLSVCCPVSLCACCPFLQFLSAPPTYPQLLSATLSSPSRMHTGLC